MKIDASIYRDLGPIEDPNAKSTSDVDSDSNNASSSTNNTQNKASVQITSEAKELLKLQNEIGKLSEVDQNKVNAAKAKLARGEFDILSNTDARLEAAEQIADKLIEMQTKN